MPKRVPNPMLDYDDGGLRFPRTMEQAFGYGLRHPLCEATPVELDEHRLKRLLLRAAYVLVLMLLAGATWGYL